MPPDRAFTFPILRWMFGQGGMNKQNPVKLQRAYAYWGFEGCVVPGCTGRPRLHHIVPKAKGGTDGYHNRLPICTKHEELIHRAGYVSRMMEQYGTGPELDYWISLNKRERRALRRSGENVLIAQR